MKILSHSKIIYVFILLTISIALLGCKKDEPDPAGVSWTKIKVEYCVGSASKVTMKSWICEDQKILAELHANFIIKKKHYLTLVPTMLTNSISLKLSDGNEIIMYVYNEERLSFYNLADRQQSFAIDVEKGFVEKLKYVLQSSTGENVSFYYDREVHILPIVNGDHEKNISSATKPTENADKKE